jgi:hypothetical protein
MCFFQETLMAMSPSRPLPTATLSFDERFRVCIPNAGVFGMVVRNLGARKDVSRKGGIGTLIL